MSLIRDVVLALLMTSISGSILMFVWMAIAHFGIEKLNTHYIYWMLRGVLSGYLFMLIYLIIHRCLEYIWNKYDVLSVSTMPIDRVIFVLFLVWLAGISVMTVSQIHIWIYFLRIKKSCMAAPKEYILLLRKLCTDMKIQKTFRLYQGYGVKSPFVYGVKNPVIYLPVKTFDINELEIILYHELIHYKQGDTFFKPVFGVIGNIYWFSILSRILWKSAIRWTESNCDAYCCEEKIEMKTYCNLLYEMMSADCFLLNSYAPMWTEGYKELEWRINCMKRQRKFKKKPSFAVIAIIVAVSISCGGLSAHAAAQGMTMIYQKAFSATVEETEEPLQENELPEYSGTVDEFAGMEIVEHHEDGKDTRSNVSMIDWTVNNNATHYSSGFNMKIGGEIDMSVSIEPSDRTVKVGIVKPDGKTTYVTGKKLISHTFSVTKTGTYKVFVSNSSGKKVTVNGFYTK